MNKNHPILVTAFIWAISCLSQPLLYITASEPEEVFGLFPWAVQTLLVWRSFNCKCFHMVQAHCIPPGCITSEYAGATELPCSVAGRQDLLLSPLYFPAGSDSTVRLRPDSRADKSYNLRPARVISASSTINPAAAWAGTTLRPTEAEQTKRLRAQLPCSRAQNNNLHLNTSTPRP